MSQLSVRNRRRFGIVPDHILEDKTLSLAARAVAAWLAGRQDGFTIYVEKMRTYFLGITEKQWRSVRKELELRGWWRSSRSPSGVRGRFVWTHEFCDDGFGDEQTTILPFGMDGQSMDAEKQDIPTPVYQKDVYHPLPPINELFAAAHWHAKNAGKKVGGGWAQTVRKRLEQATTEVDLETWRRWKLHHEQLAERNVQLAVARQGPALDPAFKAVGDELLANCAARRARKKAA